MKAMSFNQFAQAVGEQGAAVKAAAATIAAAFAKATPEQQADLRGRWKLYHLIGQGFEQPQAERILSLGKGGKAKKAHIEAIDRAYSDFRYYIVTKPKSKKPKSPSPESHARVAVPKVKVEQAVELFAGMTREQIKALVDRALSQITFE